jgi:hypothetical protein
MTISRDAPRDDWPRHVTLPGARTPLIRPMTPSDAEGLGALYTISTKKGVYRRCFSGHAPFEPFVKKMTHVAEREGFGLIVTKEEARARAGSSAYNSSARPRQIAVGHCYDWFRRFQQGWVCHAGPPPGGVAPESMIGEHCHAHLEHRVSLLVDRGVARGRRVLVH